MHIRPERPDDHGAIAALTAKAFEGTPYSDGREAGIPAALREAGQLTLSLVADEGGSIVGHVAFSPAEVGGVGGWVALGPISVAAGYRRRGIARVLIAEGLGRLRATDALGCVLIGDPAVYRHAGFTPAPGLTYAGVPAEYVLALSFGPLLPMGEIIFAPAFASPNG